MSRISFSILGQINAHAARLDARLPKDFKTGAAALVELEQKAKAYARNVRNVSVSDTILDALDRDADPYDDEIVHEALMHEKVAEYASRVDIALDRRAEFFLATTANDVLRAFKPAVEKAGATLETAVEKLGDIDDDDLVSVLNRRGDAAQVWADARDAEQDIQAVLSLRKYLSSVAGSGVRNPGQYAALVVADIPASDFTGQQLRNTMPRGWAIARAGWPFALAVGEELEARIARLLSANQVTEEEQAEAFSKAHKRMYGTGAA